MGKIFLFTFPPHCHYCKGTCDHVSSAPVGVCGVPRSGVLPHQHARHIGWAGDYCSSTRGAQQENGVEIPSRGCLLQTNLWGETFWVLLPGEGEKEEAETRQRHLQACHQAHCGGRGGCHRLLQV